MDVISKLDGSVGLDDWDTLEWRCKPSEENDEENKDIWRLSRGHQQRRFLSYRTEIDNWSFTEEKKEKEVIEEDEK